MKIGWSFPLNNGGEGSGPNNGAMDAFAGTRLSSLVREVIQNSLDAPVPGNNPVRISFQLNEISKACIDIKKAIELGYDRESLAELIGLTNCTP